MSPYFLSGKSERFDLSFFCCPRKETGLHIVQEIYKMTTILNQKQIPWPFFTENLVKMKILNTFNFFLFYLVRNRRQGVEDRMAWFLYKGLCPVYLLGSIWPSCSWYIELSCEQDELVHSRVVSKCFHLFVYSVSTNVKKINKMKIMFLFVCAWMLSNYKT